MSVSVKKYQIIGGLPSGGVDRNEVIGIIDEYLHDNPIKGEDGYSPTIDVIEFNGGTQVVITDVNGEHVFEVSNGKDAVLDVETVRRMVDAYLTENPPVPKFTINGEGPDENGNFVVKTHPDEIDNVVAF